MSRRNKYELTDLRIEFDDLRTQKREAEFLWKIASEFRWPTPVLDHLGDRCNNLSNALAVIEHEMDYEGIHEPAEPATHRLYFSRKKEFFL